MLDHAAIGAAKEVEPKFTSYSDPANQRTGALKGPVFFAYANNYLIYTDHTRIGLARHKSGWTLTSLQYRAINMGTTARRHACFIVL